MDVAAPPAAAFVDDDVPPLPPNAVWARFKVPLVDPAMAFVRVELAPPPADELADGPPLPPLPPV